MVEALCTRLSTFWLLTSLQLLASLQPIFEALCIKTLVPSDCWPHYNWWPHYNQLLKPCALDIVSIDRGVHPYLRQWCIPPRLRFPPISKKLVRLRVKFSQFYLFLKKFPISFRQNLWLPFLFPPYFYKFPSDFVKFTCFFILYVFFLSPYFDHDAFMHHTMHVLDAPVNI